MTGLQICWETIQEL